MNENTITTTVNAGSEENPFPVDIVEKVPAKKEPMSREQLGLPMPSAEKTPDLTPKPKGPTAAESYKKQQEREKLARLEKATSTDSTTPAKPKEKAVPKTVAAKKKSASKAASKPKPKPSANGHVSTHAKKTGLRTMQLRALSVLKDAKEGMTITELAKRAKISPVVMQRGIGAINPDKRVESDASNGFKSLLTMKYVTIAKVEGENVITATDKGLAKFKDDLPENGIPKKHASRYSTLKKPPKKAKAK